MAAPPQANPPRADAPASGGDGLIALAVAGLVVVTVAIGALAPGQAAKPVPATALSPEDDPACAEWSDGCHVCQRRPVGAACSLPGIACTPGAFACLRRTAGP